VSQKLSTSKENFQIIEEASVETRSRTLKPDLAVISQGRVHVVDVTVRHEDMGYLEGGHKSKIEKYTPLFHILAEQLPSIHWKGPTSCSSHEGSYAKRNVRLSIRPGNNRPKFPNDDLSPSS